MTDFHIHCHIHALNCFNSIQLQAVGYIIENYIPNCAVSEEYIMKHVKEILKKQIETYMHRQMVIDILSQPVLHHVFYIKATELL